MASFRITDDSIRQAAIAKLAVVDAQVYSQRLAARLSQEDDGDWHCLSVRPMIGAPIEFVLRRRTRAELLQAIENRTCPRST